MTAYGQLRKWLDLEGMSQRRLASILGLGESAVWAWGQGRTRPSLDVAVALERVTKGAVPAEAWASECVVEGAVRRAEETDG